MVAVEGRLHEVHRQALELPLAILLVHLEAASKRCDGYVELRLCLDHAGQDARVVGILAWQTRRVHGLATRLAVGTLLKFDLATRLVAVHAALARIEEVGVVGVRQRPLAVSGGVRPARADRAPVTDHLGDGRVSLLDPQVRVDAPVPLGRPLLDQARGGIPLGLDAEGRLPRQLPALDRPRADAALLPLRLRLRVLADPPWLPPLDDGALVVRLLVRLDRDPGRHRVLPQTLWGELRQVPELGLVVLNVVVRDRVLSLEGDGGLVVRHRRLLGRVEGPQVRVLALHHPADPGLPPARVGPVAHPPELRLAPGEPVAPAAQLGQELLLGHLPDRFGLLGVVREREVQAVLRLAEEDGRLVVGPRGLLLRREGPQVDLLLVLPHVALPPPRHPVLGHALVHARALAALGLLLGGLARLGMTW
mmetsp:Transcript_10891/g.30640  ORF Transcript_10891/g.30640 Transcript_10891/m.30640 type:complete len:421 (+) Transcript_10891:571-1833(+)